MRNFLRVAQVAEMLGVSESTIWRWSSDGHFPSPLKVSAGVTVWRKCDAVEAVEIMAQAYE